MIASLVDHFQLIKSKITVKCWDFKKMNAFLGNSPLWIYVKAFSFTENLNKLFSSASTKDLTCIHGIRVLTFIWIIFGHTAAWVNYQIFSKIIKRIIKSRIKKCDQL